MRQRTRSQELAKVSVSREIDAVFLSIWIFVTALLAKLLADEFWW